ncbi:MAG: hypothetical protein ACYC5O_06590 [Anaerolineae bacterium]
MMALLLVAGCGAPPATATATAAAPLCPGAGPCVAREFMPFYLAHADLLGPPLAAPSQYRERLVQYFRAGRLELVPENPPGYEVGLAYLGEEVCGRQPPLHYADVPSYLDGSRRYFAETGHTVRDDFLGFFAAEGGVNVFGSPISEQRPSGAEVVQDFLRLQVRRDASGRFYLAPLGELVLAGATPPAGLCPSVPADDPDA